MKYIITLSLISTVLLTGCSYAKWADLKSQGSEHHIQLYSGGKLIGEWESTGAVENQHSSDGFYFQDAITGNKVEVCGQVIITVK